MDLTVARKMIQEYVTGHGEFLKQALTADRYYNNLMISYSPPAGRRKRQRVISRTPCARQTIESP